MKREKKKENTNQQQCMGPTISNHLCWIWSGLRSEQIQCWCHQSDGWQFAPLISSGVTLTWCQRKEAANAAHNFISAFPHWQQPGGRKYLVCMSIYSVQLGLIYDKDWESNFLQICSKHPLQLSGSETPHKDLAQKWILSVLLKQFMRHLKKKKRKSHVHWTKRMLKF